MFQRCMKALLVVSIVGMSPHAVGAAGQDAIKPASDITAPEMFRRFLERLANDCPVAGKFEIRGEISAQMLADTATANEQQAAQKGLKYVGPEPKPFLKCRWAWDGEREMLETLPESTVFESFFSTPDTFLEGVVERNYNLVAPKKAYSVRPASFYFLMGTRPWPEVEKEARVEFDDAAESSPLGTNALRLVLPMGRVRLFVRESDYRPQGHEIYLNEKLFHRMTITSFTEGADGRAFPNAAELAVIHPVSGEVVRKDLLQAVQVHFPTGEAELNDVFSMDLPAGAEVHDLLLNKELTLKSETPVADVVGVPDEQRWKSMESSPAGQMTPQPPPLQPGRRRWLIWVNVVVFAAIAAMFIFRSLRRKRH